MYSGDYCYSFYNSGITKIVTIRSGRDSSIIFILKEKHNVENEVYGPNTNPLKLDQPNQQKSELKAEFCASARRRLLLD